MGLLDWAKKKLKQAGDFIGGLIGAGRQLAGNVVNAVGQLPGKIAGAAQGLKGAAQRAFQQAPPIPLLGVGSPLGASAIVNKLAQNEDVQRTAGNAFTGVSQVLNRTNPINLPQRVGEVAQITEKIPIVGDVTKPFGDLVQSGTAPVRAVGQLLQGDVAGANREVMDSPLLRKQLQAKQEGKGSVQQFTPAVGLGAEVGTTLAPFPALKGGSLLARAGKGALAGGVAGGGFEAGRQVYEQEPFNPQNIGVASGIGAGTVGAMPFIGRGASAVANKVRNEVESLVRPQDVVKVVPKAPPVTVTRSGAPELQGIPKDQAKQALGELKARGSVTVEPQNIITETVPSKIQSVRGAQPTVQTRPGIKIVETPSPSRVTPKQPVDERLVEELRDNGAQINPDGTARLFYRTSPETARKIRESGQVFGKENGVFFSTKRDGQATGYGNEVFEFDVPLDRVILDDVFGNEAHLRLPTKKAGDAIPLRDLNPVSAKKTKPPVPSAAIPLKEKFTPESNADFATTQAQKAQDDMVRAADEVAGVPPVNDYTGVPGAGQRLRSVPETIKESDTALPGLKDVVKSQEYDVLPNRETMDRALQSINRNPQAALNEALSASEKDAVSTARSLLLAENAQKRGDFDLANQIFEALAPGKTSQGQAIQVLSVWGKTTPEGVVRYAKKVVDDANNVVALKGGNPRFTLTPEKAAQFRKQSESIQAMPEGREKLIATQKMLNDIEDQVPASVNTKLQSSLYYAQLLNPKTIIRNIGGNFGMMLTENVKDVVGAPIDALTTAVMRVAGKDAQRSVYMPRLLKQLSAGADEAGKAWQEVKAGVNLSRLEGQLQIGNKPRAFKGPVGSFLDKSLQAILSVPDRFFFGARQEQTLMNLMKAAGVKKPTKEMLEQARADGMYATFQDDSNAAKLFVNVKKGLNMNKDFGVGSFALNYPKTPGNLLARGIDYSPAGFIKATMNIAKPLFNRGPFDKKAFTENLSRAIVGTGGLVGTGAILHNAGIITAGPDDNKSLNALQRATGLGAYRINTSALKRWVSSGFNPDEAKLRDNDTLVTYDWFQPAAIGLAMGANIDENKGLSEKTVGSLVNALAGGTETIAEQPLVTGLQRLFGYGDPSKGVLEVAVGGPASFIPTLVSQINQLTNNAVPETYDPDPIKRAGNLVKARIPGLSQTLPERVTPFGDELQRYQNGTNNPLNVFLNPAFISKYQPKPYEKEVLDTVSATGDKGVVPTLTEKKMTINGKDVSLTAQEMIEFQKATGQSYKAAIENMMSRPSYQSASPELKAHAFTNAEKDTRAVSKLVFETQREGYSEAEFEKKYSGLSTTQRQIFNGKFPDYVANAAENEAKDAFNKENEPVISPEFQNIYDGYLTLPAKSQQRRDYLASHPELQDYFDKKDAYLLAYKDKFGELPFGAKEPFKKFSKGGSRRRGYRRGGGRKGGSIKIANPKLKTKVGKIRTPSQKRKKQNTVKIVATKKAKSTVGRPRRAPIKYRRTTIKIKKA